MTRQVELELAILNGCLAVYGGGTSEIDTQFYENLVEDRDASGSGFITSLRQDDAALLLPKTFSNDVNLFGARLNASREEVGFVVMVEKGCLRWVEGFTYSGNEWPKIDKYELYRVREPIKPYP